MSLSRVSRREFLRSSAAAAAAVSLPHASAAARAPASSTLAPLQLEKRRFGKTDMQVGLLGFGGAEIGFERTGQATVDKLLNAALDAGINVIDTAECYADSEVQIAKAIGKRRKDYHLFTKCGHVLADGKRGDSWNKAGVLASVERSLKRLETDVIDLVQLHSCSLAELQKGECIEALEQAKKEGKTRYIGYSGDSRTARWAVECGRFDALQISVNIADQECVDLVLPLAKEKQMGVIAKRPIANAAWRYETRPESGGHQEYWRRLQELKFEWAMGEAIKQQGVDGPAAIAMRFTAMQPGVSVLIVGTTKPERVQQNIGLLAAGPLPKELAESIRARWRAVAKPDWVGQT